MTNDEYVDTLRGQVDSLKERVADLEDKVRRYRHLLLITYASCGCHGLSKQYIDEIQGILNERKRAQYPM